MDPQVLFAGVAAGTESVPTDPLSVQQLAQQVWEASRSPDEPTRGQGLSVALALGQERALELLLGYARDPSPALRRRAYDYAVTQLPSGLGVVREAAGGNDHDLAVDALALLADQADASASPIGRTLLRSPNPAVRAGAATLLGRVAGNVVVPQLRALTEDAEPAVRRAARRALARILGEDEPTPPLDDPPPSSGELAPPPPEPSAPQALPAVRAASSARRDQPREPAEAAPLPAPTALELSTPSAPGSAWSPTTPSALPPKLPTEGLALVRLLARVSAPNRGPILEALRHVDASELAQVVSGYRPGTDLDRGRGIGVAAMFMGNQRWVGALRGHLSDPDPGVRTTALLALAGLPSPSLLPAIARCGADPEPAVRATTAWCLGRAALAIDASSFALGYLQALATDKEPEVQAAARTALELLGGTSA